MSHFDTQIEELMSETESNIYGLEKMIFSGRYRFLAKDFTILSKQSLVILYSLWEGFVQEAFSLFLREVENSTTSYFDLKESFMISQIEKNFKQFNEYPQKLKGKVHFHTTYFQEIIQPKHPIKTVVDLKNNVGLKILNELLDIHGAEKINKYWEEKEYNHPNPNIEDLLNDLLDIRNNTAHGNNIRTDVIINQTEFEKYKKLIIDLIYEVGRLLSECINNKTYLKSNS